MKDSKESMILVKMWNFETNTAYYTNRTLSSIVEDPSGVNLELFALHLINIMRAEKNLPALSHVPIDEEMFKAFLKQQGRI